MTVRGVEGNDALCLLYRQEREERKEEQDEKEEKHFP